MQIEVWKQIKGFNGNYKVSNFGRVMSIMSGKENIIFVRKDRRGYLCVRLSENCKIKQYFVHRLVALTFIGESNLTVNHKDFNKENNHIDNLEFMTIKENLNHYYASLKK